MRSAVSAAALVLVVAACGSPAGQAISGPGSTTRIAATTSTTSSTPAPTTTGGTVPGERPPDDEQSGSDDQAYPEDGFPPDEDESVRLSIEDALLPDDAFGAPWELQWRQLDAVGFGADPNQTDCDEYWAYEELLSGDGGHAMWWVDGGNANHRVIRIDNTSEVLADLVALGSIADNCPVVNWNEGGSFTVELFTPDVDAFVMRFDDKASGEVTWVAVTLFGDLLSVLQIPLWTRADDTMIEVDLDEVTLVAAQMFQRLQEAGPEPTPPTSLPAPTTIPVATTIPDPSTIVTPPPRPDIGIPPVTLDALGELLLTADELPDGWDFSQIEEYVSGSSDEEFVEACPAAVAFDRFDEVLAWEADLRNPEGRDASEIIGEMGDPADAAALVQQFAEVAACDLSVLMSGATGRGGLRDIEGADLAAVVVIEAAELGDTRLQLGAAAVGSTVVVFTIDSNLDGPAADQQLRESMTLAVAKIAAATP